MSPSRLPLLAVTMGDAAGVGPEIVVKALADPGVRAAARVLVVGDLRLLEHWRDRLALSLRLGRVDDPSQAADPDVIEVVEPVALPWPVPVTGRPTAEAGRAAVACIERATALSIEGKADAVVTAPISKAAIRLAGSPFPGHTEMLAHLTGTREYAMMLVGGGLRVSLATIHIPLAEVPRSLDTGRLAAIIRLTAEATARMGFPRPKVAVCGLNPHAGEGGMFGREEELVIAPAIDRCAAQGIAVSGPWPADTVFYRALKGDFDAVVAMYHDQGLGPLKTVGFDEGVNVTLGLPIVRTSVDHGTAYDIAGKGVADPRSLIAAMKLAATMVHDRC